MGNKVLLIEDDLLIRDLYKYCLTQAGIDTIAAIDGEEGLRLAMEKPDLILLDILLPKIHGIDVLKKLKANSVTKNIAVVMLTNLGEEQVIKEAFQLGIKGYLVKVRLTPQQIVEHVKKFLQDPEYKMSFESL